MTTENDHILRSEYEQYVRTAELRHNELRLEQKEDVTELKAQISTLGNKIDTLSTQLARRGNDGWKLLATSMTSLVGGYILYYLQHLLVH